MVSITKAPRKVKSREKAATRHLSSRVCQRPLVPTTENPLLDKNGNFSSLALLTRLLWERADQSGKVFLKVTEVAKLMRLSRQQIYNLVRRAKLFKNPPFRVVASKNRMGGTYWILSFHSKFSRSCKPPLDNKVYNNTLPPYKKNKSTKCPLKGDLWTPQGRRTPTIRGRRWIMMRARRVLGRSQVPTKDLERLIGQKLWKAQHSWGFWNDVLSLLERLIREGTLEEVTRRYGKKGAKGMLIAMLKEIQRDRAYADSLEKESEAIHKQIEEWEREKREAHFRQAQLERQGLKPPSLKEYRNFDDYLRALDEYRQACESLARKGGSNAAGADFEGAAPAFATPL